MKNAYFLIFALVLLVLSGSPLFAQYNILRVVVESILFFIFIVLAIKEWRKNNKLGTVAYIIFMAICAINIFDKSDKYFYVQIILIALAVLLLIFKIYKTRK